MFNREIEVSVKCEISQTTPVNRSGVQTGSLGLILNPDYLLSYNTRQCFFRRRYREGDFAVMKEEGTI